MLHFSRHQEELKELKLFELQTIEHLREHINTIQAELTEKNIQISAIQTTETQYQSTMDTLRREANQAQKYFYTQKQFVLFLYWKCVS